jgi:hypothetical protein
MPWQKVRSQTDRQAPMPTSVRHQWTAQTPIPSCSSRVFSSHQASHTLSEFRRTKKPNVCSRVPAGTGSRAPSRRCLGPSGFDPSRKPAQRVSIRRSHSVPRALPAPAGAPLRAPSASPDTRRRVPPAKMRAPCSLHCLPLKNAKGAALARRKDNRRGRGSLALLAAPAPIPRRFSLQLSTPVSATAKGSQRSAARPQKQRSKSCRRKRPPSPFPPIASTA